MFRRLAHRFSDRHGRTSDNQCHESQERQGAVPQNEERQRSLGRRREAEQNRRDLSLIRLEERKCRAEDIERHRLKLLRFERALALSREHYRRIQNLVPPAMLWIMHDMTDLSRVVASKP